MRKRILLFISIACLQGCAIVKDLTTEHKTVKRDYLREEMEGRVVYTPLLKSRNPTDPGDIEVLLRLPEKKFREIGLISMYRKYDNESAAVLLPWVKERAAKEGGNAVLLMEIEEKPIGVISGGGSSVIGNNVVSSSYSSLVKEGTIRGTVIVYVP